MEKVLSISAIILSLFSLPFYALAHGTEEEHQKELLMATILKNGLIASIISFVVLIIIWYLLKKKMNRLNVKKKEESVKRNQLNKLSKVVLLTSILPLLSLIIIGFIQNNQSSKNTLVFPHIHGLDYTSDGHEIFVPSHNGLNIYANNTWSNQTQGELHDYMGFSMFEGGFYSSGHPAPGSKMGNPFGIVKSMDKGKTLEVLDLYKEVDFHGMTVGYRTKDIYVFNPEANSRMDKPGFYYSTDETKTWEQSNLEGLVGQPTTLAAHPTEKGIIAIGTNQGAFVSEDYGNTFEPLLNNVNVTALSFDHNNSLLVGIQGKLLLISLDGTSQSDFNIPPLDSDDAISYVKQNPKEGNEYVFSTLKKDIFLTIDSGKTWDKIVNQGVVSR